MQKLKSCKDIGALQIYLYCKYSKSQTFKKDILADFYQYYTCYKQTQCDTKLQMY